MKTFDRTEFFQKNLPAKKTFTCSNSTIQTLEEDVKYVQS